MRFPLRLMTCLPLLVVLLTGCDAIKDIAEGETESQTPQVTQVTPQNTTVEPGTQPPAAQPPVAQPAPAKSADDIVQEFQRRATGALSDQIVTGFIDQLEKVNGLDKVTKLNLNSAAITGNGIKQLARLPALIALDLTSTGLEPDGFAALKELKTLQELSLRSTIFDSSSAVHLVPLTNLRVLDLEETQLFDDGLAQLDALTNLEELMIAQTKLTGEGFAAWKNPHKLKKLDARYTQFSLGGMQAITKFQATLEDLDVSSSHLTAEHLQWIPKLKSLKHLNIGYNRLDDVAVKIIQPATWIETLNLTKNSGIRDVSLSFLIKWKNLRMVYAEGTSIMPIGVAQFHKYLPECVVFVKGREYGPVQK